MTKKELYRAVQLLKAGQIVWIDGNSFQAGRIPEEWDLEPCSVCSLDSICVGDVERVCREMDYPKFDRYFLKLAHRAKEMCKH